MRFNNEHGRKRQLATILTNSLFLCIGVLIVVVVLQNYQVNRDVVAQEVARTKKQTKSLVQEIFNLRVKSLEITQDSYSRNRILVEGALAKNVQSLDRFFNSIDQLSPDVAPDFRYIRSNDNLIWDDGNFQFYGISKSQINHLSAEMSTGPDWHISQTPSSLGVRYLAMRRTAIVDINSGEVVGHLYIGIVLNNNFSLVNAIAKGGNADEILLAVGSEVIAASTKNQSFKHIEWLEQSSKSLNASRYMVSRTDVTINNVPTFLSVYTVQSNEHIMAFVQSHYVWILVTAMFVVGIAIYTRVWLGQRVSNELQSLMRYTDATIQEQKVTKFEGSSIEEFDQIASSFERSFKRLHEQEKQFADLFNFSLSPITLWDSNGELNRFNPAAERSFRQGRAQEQLIDSLRPHIRMCAQGATLTGINTTIASKTFRWNLSPISNDNNITHIMAQGQDITSFIEAERQSEAAREQAEESARARADFLARMSHELRTPLNGILGVSQLLKGKMEDEQDVEHMDILCNSGEHLLAVLNDILDFSKIEQGKFHIENRVFRLLELTTTVDKIFKPLCDSKEVNFIVASNIDDKMWVFSDQVRLNQIIFNLVSNAVKFTHQGQVRVDLNCELKNNGYLLSIDVQDSGIGIEHKRLRDIFEPFVQAEATTTREYGGSGLGLAIVHSLVSIMEGKITVDSEVDRGTRFSAKMPLQIGKEKVFSVGDLEAEPATLFSEPLHVLLVEDNHTNAFIAKAFCEKYGMKVSWVEDGINAIEMLKSDSSISLVLMDNQLPNLGGIEATEIIRNDLELAVPIYACTADGMQETRNEFLRAGANYVIVKPIKEAALNKAFVYFKEHHYSLVE
ncbi:quorum-sensing autoinducer 2 sensor kinase/phosphatase LuxQ [Vibrio bivalvicida]|uniref:Autoinducer 2 sensor kinase/phosphatase LuxQ n=1 Tax=Vibrio bivalvicida TaxID=1276888 RepID=A0A177Y4N7_9VIBR|nr:quorum-sensing autoinducer 2 sensor kinase/phosphatase LuxQ [Vibrio bivalvicida]OAJ95838.1 ATPase [Vibrio bivalvicida]